MEDTKIIERLVAVEEARKSITEKINEHDEQIKELQNTYKIMEKMNYRMGNLESSVTEIKEEIQKGKESKGAKWDKLIDYIFYSVLALLLGYIATKLGLK